ncbi:MAG: hypothetical protein JW841_07315 [Deltaproteobacteria bacterium]|nr:hypothetical protein [Deltaproteobacteria bacterium]
MSGKSKKLLLCPIDTNVKVLPKIKFTFEEYTEVEIDIDKSPWNSYKQKYEKVVIKGKKNWVKKINDKWIYVFRSTKDPNYFKFNREIHALNGKFREIDIDTRNYKKEDTWEDSKPFWLEIDEVKVDYYVCLSQIQLNMSRIEDIRSELNNNGYSKRLQKIELDNESVANKQQYILLYDYLELAEKYSQKYVRKTNSFSSWVEVVKEKKFINDRINEICNYKSEYWKHVDRQLVEKDKKEYLNTYADKLVDYAKIHELLLGIFKTAAFTQLQKDYEDNNEKEFFEKYIPALKNINWLRSGLEYLKDIINDDNCLLNKRQAFAKEINKDFFELLTNNILYIFIEELTVPLIEVYGSEKVCEYLCAVIKYNLSVSDIKIGEKLVGNTKIKFLNVPGKYGDNWAQNLKNASKIYAGIKVLFATINTYLAVKGLSESKSLGEGTVHGLEISAGIVQGFEALNLFLKLSDKTLNLMGAYVSMVQIISSTWGMMDCIEDKDYDAAVGYGVQIAGSFTCMVGAAICANAAATGTGLSLAGAVSLTGVGAIVIAIGVGIVIFGTFVVWMYKDDKNAITEWMQYCHYGIKGKQNKNLENQITDLNNILFGLSASAGILYGPILYKENYYSTPMISLKINPSHQITNKSKLYYKLCLQIDGQEKVIAEGSALVHETGLYFVLKDKHSALASVDVNTDIIDLYNIENAKITEITDLESDIHMASKLYCEYKIDLFGDGVYIIHNTFKRDILA